MNVRTLLLFLCITSVTSAVCFCEEVLFEDSFDHGLSDKWKVSGKLGQDYRVRDGAIELRIRGGSKNVPVLYVELPFATQDTVIASVNVKPLTDLKRGEEAGLSLLHNGQPEFSVKKTNIDGYRVFAPGEVEFIGKDGQEGDPADYAVKYWPSRESDGPLRIIVRSHYVHFQVGPSKAGAYKTYFHSAIEENTKGMGFGLFTVGADNNDGWVQFDNFRVVKS